MGKGLLLIGLLMVMSLAGAVPAQTPLARAAPLTMEGSSKTIEARSGTAGRPTTLLRALLQFTIIVGGAPRSAMVAGALNSAITNFGS